jgi:class 3 adenylate cyclase
LVRPLVDVVAPVVGNHVKVAALLATLAEPGQILVSERTMAAVQERVDGVPVEDLGPPRIEYTPKGGGR